TLAVEPLVELAIATGRTVADAGGLSPDAIERGAGATAIRGAVAVDGPTSRLLADHFDVRRVAGGMFALSGERPRRRDAPITLLSRESPCVGRDRELAALGGLLDECIAEPVARAALVTGGAGVGKSRIRQEFE